MAAEAQTRNDWEQVWMWREDYFKAAGIPRADVLRLLEEEVSRGDVEALLARGCPPELVAPVLLGRP
jgi:hypothetical protein